MELLKKVTKQVQNVKSSKIINSGEEGESDFQKGHLM